VRETRERHRPGRPRIGYRPVAGRPPARRRHLLLAEMLTGLVAKAIQEPGGCRARP